MATLINIVTLDASATGGTGGTVGRGIRVPASIPAQLTTNFAGANNDLTFTAKGAGTAGNAVTVTFTVAGANTPLTIGVAGNAITVNVATSAGSAATSTATQVVAAVRASGPASALVSVDHAAGNDGTGVVAAQGATALSGGVNAGAVERGEVQLRVGQVLQVDIDKPYVRQRLGRARGRWISSPNGSTQIWLRSLETSSSSTFAQSFISRGVDINTALAASTGTSIGLDVGQVVAADLSKPAVRKSLRQHWSRLIVGNPVTSTVTLRGLTTSGGAPGGGISSGRGFRVPAIGVTGGAGSATIAVVNSTTNVQVDTANVNVRRALRRNLGRWVVISSP